MTDSNRIAWLQSQMAERNVDSLVAFSSAWHARGATNVVQVLTGRDLAIAADLPDGLKTHAAIGGSLGHGIGLTLTEFPYFSSEQLDGMVEDGTYSLTVGLSDGRRNHALTSAMVVIGAGGAEILWRAP